MLLPEPLPAHVKVRVVNPDAQDYGRQGEIVGTADMELGSRRGEWFIVRFSDHDAGYQADELEWVNERS